MKFFPSTPTIPGISSQDTLEKSSNLTVPSAPEATKTASSPRSSNLVSVTQNSASLNTVTPTAIASSQTQTAAWSPALNQLLEEPPATFPQRLTVGAMVFCCAVGAWAWFGKIDEVSKAQGKLIPQGETYKVEPVELGKVKHIAVKEGEKVRSEQTLIEFDTELAEQEVVRLEQMLQGYRSELLQKQALREKLTLEAQTRKDLTEAETSAQRAAVLLAEEKAATFRGLLARQQLELKAYLHKQANLELLPNLVKEQLNQLNAETRSRQQRLNKLQPLAQQGAVSQEYLFQAEQSLREAQRQMTQSQLQEITNIDEQIFQSARAMGELQTRITSNQGELASALQEIEKQQAELIQKQAEGRRTQLEIQQKIKQLEFEQAQIKSKIVDTQNSLSTAKAKLKQKVLKAPVNGIVSSLNIDNSGQVIQTGETVMEIAPEGIPLVLTAFLPNQEAGFIEEGMPVQVKFDAYPYQYYGLIPGKVSHLSADAQLDSQQQEAYQVEIELQRNYITDNHKQIKFKAGQTATADIVIRRRRILDVWLEPIKKLQHDGIEM
ncbi:MAG: HlyD family efflux transporter periplasmic adaptor subunit [Pleurocapsa sp. MO_226.B13]|nr:HlyD family efflux transporter periplasmic adaptor subunit [Pleurocapsa sp. MO_226.B13]